MKRAIKSNREHCKDYIENYNKSYALNAFCRTVRTHVFFCKAASTADKSRIFYF